MSECCGILACAGVHGILIVNEGCWKWRDPRVREPKKCEDRVRDGEKRTNTRVRGSVKRQRERARESGSRQGRAGGRERV